MEQFSDPEPPSAIAAYAQQHNLSLGNRLGFGIDGIVWSTTRPSAIKSFNQRIAYENERDVYVRLLMQNVESIAGFTIPKLIEHHNNLYVIEMELVSPPFILDFAGAYLDSLPPFTQEEIAEWLDSRQELFDDDWQWVRRAYFGFQRYGIYLNDLKPGNVTCR